MPPLLVVEDLDVVEQLVLAPADRLEGLAELELQGRCLSCKEDFTFSASEQRFWYEERRFWVDSFPTRCATCRKQDRARLQLKKTYDSLIKTALFKRSSKKLKRQVISLIDQLATKEAEVSESMQKNRATLRAQLAK